MATSVPGVLDLTLQKFVDAMIASTVRRDGTAPAAAPNAFKDRVGKTILPSGSEVTVTFKINPDGLSAHVTVQVMGDPNGSQAILGDVSLAVLATKLV